MNNEIVKVLTPEEYITTFLDHNLRIDRRDLTQRRDFSYQFGILDTFSTSASCLLGEGNKIIAVLKSHNESEFEEEIPQDSSNFISKYFNIILKII
jgi:exosome complex RNA-binding protein Rrp42 (RNase PH superfamily)